MLNKIDKWLREGSGWIMNKIGGMYCNIARYSPQLGGSYIPTPPKLAVKKAIINIKNE